MKSWKHLLLVAAVFAIGSGQVVAQKMSKADKKGYKQLLKVGTWEAKGLSKNGSPVDFTAYAEMLMDFEKHTTKKNKKKTVRHVLWIDMSGGNRNFDFEYKNDSIQFLNVRGLNDYRVVSVDKELLIMEQVLNQDLYRWKFLPADKAKLINQATIAKSGRKKKK
jgi:hypothetical protein